MKDYKKMLPIVIIAQHAVERYYFQTGVDLMRVIATLENGFAGIWNPSTPDVVCQCIEPIS
jgi:hypothetical protein